MWIISIVPNIFWMISIACLIHNQKIDGNKKIFYMLVLQFIFLPMCMIGNSVLLDEESVETATTIIDLMTLLVVAYYGYEYKHEFKTDANKYHKYAIVGLIACFVIIVFIFFILEIL